MLIAHFFRLLLALISSPPANDHAIPSPTTESTPRSSTMLITNLIIWAKTDWNPASHIGISQIYFRLATGPLHASHTAPFGAGDHACPDGKLLSQIHFAPGTTSDVNIFIGPDVLLTSAAYPVFNTSPDERRASMSRSIFGIYFRVGMWRYQSWSWDQQGGWWGRYLCWWVWIFTFWSAPPPLLMWSWDRLHISAWI